MDVLVVGAGEMGRWFARALLEDAPEPVSVTFADTDPAAASAAADAFGDAATTTVDDAPAVATVCIAVPIPAAAAAIERWAGRAESAIVDLTGTMATPVAAMERHAPALERLSLHPLFAPANEPGNVAAVPANPDRLTDLVHAALTDRGNAWFETTPAEHDRAMETVQARTHTAVLAYALAAEPVDDRFHTPVSGTLADLVEQVLDGDPGVYADIQTTFEGAEDVADAAGRLADASPETFSALFEAARR